MESEPVAFEPQSLSELLYLLFVVDGRHSLEIQIALPVLLSDGRPNPIVEGVLVALLELLVLVGGEELWHRYEHLLDLVPGGLDDLLEEVEVDVAVGELEMIEHQPDLFDVLLLAEEELAHLLQDEVLQLAVLQREVVLDVYVEDPLGVAAGREGAGLHVQLFEQLQLPQEEAAGEVVLEKLLAALLPLDLAPEDGEARLLDLEDLLEAHRLLAHLVLDLVLDGLVVAGGEQELEVLEGRPRRTLPDLKVNLLVGEADLAEDLALVLQVLVFQLGEVAIGLEDAVHLLVELDRVAHHEGVEDLAGTGELAVDVLVEERVVVLEDGEEGEEPVVAPAVPDLDRVEGGELDAVRHCVDVYLEAVEVHAVLLDVHQDLLAGEVLEVGGVDLEVDVHGVDDVALLGDEHLLAKVEEDDVLRVVLEDEVLLERVHDVVDLVGVVDLDALGVDLHLDAPQPERLPLPLVLLEEDVHRVVDRLRHREELEPPAHPVLLLQLLGQHVRVVEEVDLEVVLVEEGDEVGGGELHVPDLVLEGEGGDEEGLALFLLDGGVAVEDDLFDGQHEHYLL